MCCFDSSHLHYHLCRLPDAPLNVVWSAGGSWLCEAYYFLRNNRLSHIHSAFFFIINYYFFKCHVEMFSPSLPPIFYSAIKYDELPNTLYTHRFI